MGNWSIHIEGVGSHHNTDNASDADRMIQKIVAELWGAGYDVTYASITYGGQQLFTPKKEAGYAVPSDSPEAPGPR